MTENAIAQQIVDAAFRIHTTLGPGLLESVYDAVLRYELGRRGLGVVGGQAIPVSYDGVRIDIGFRADLIVENKVIVEIKSVEGIAAVHKKQLLTYLRLADKRLGLLINFQVALIKMASCGSSMGWKKLTPRRKAAKMARSSERTVRLTQIPRSGLVHRSARPSKNRRYVNDILRKS